MITMLLMGSGSQISRNCQGKYLMIQALLAPDWRLTARRGIDNHMLARDLSSDEFSFIFVPLPSHDYKRGAANLALLIITSFSSSPFPIVIELHWNTWKQNKWLRQRKTNADNRLMGKWASERFFRSQHNSFEQKNIVEQSHDHVAWFEGGSGGFKGL